MPKGKKKRKQRREMPPLTMLDKSIYWIAGAGMLAALAGEGHAVPAVGSIDAQLLETEAERELIKQLAALPEEITLAARDYDPSRINKYVTELAARFHKFYTVCRIRDAQSGLLEARLLLADCVRRVIATSLGVIGVTAPEKM